MKQQTKATIATASIIFLLIAAVGSVIANAQSSILSDRRHQLLTVDAPIVTSGDNVYVTWWSNKTGGNFEVLFRASNDNGQTFGPKINLSNSTNSDSVDGNIATKGKNVYVSWWERNQTSNEPVLRISKDNGKTFGPVLKLAANGTIG
jgi:hypothetical protein